MPRRRRRARGASRPSPPHPPRPRAAAAAAPPRRSFRAVAALLGLAAAALKLLLAPAAHSTDLEVHRWWMALTRARPMAAWYTDAASVWTLDYPPLFAYFERGLAAAAAAAHPPMVDPARHGYDAPEALLFMRLSVVCTDVLLIYAVFRLVSAAHAAARVLAGSAGGGARAWDARPAAAALVLFNPGLFLVDNVHFQYNGFVLAFLLLSLANLMDGNTWLGAALFAAAVHLKHTLLPAAPCVAVFLLHRVYATSVTTSTLAASRDVAGVVLAVFAVLFVSWMPLYASGGAAAVRACFARLFPFGRGLLHAYWAPNWWALYSFADKLAVAAGCSLRDADVNTTSGHIGALRPFRCLPNVSPGITAGLVMATILPVALSLPAPSRLGTLALSKKDVASARIALRLPQAVAISMLLAFAFGWHVHEKMILMATVPLGAVALFVGFSPECEATVSSYVLLSLCGHFALHPLVTSPEVTAYKLLHSLAYNAFALSLMPCYYSPLCPSLARQRLLWGRFVWLFAVLCFCTECYVSGGGHKLVFGNDRLEFLPLLLVSVTSGTGIMASLAHLTSSFMQH